MKGDFSNWRRDPRSNDQGVLHQQGRVTLDADLTAGELIDLDWRLTAAGDVIGGGVAAVPAGDPAGFRVLRARVVGDDVRVTLQPGRAWIDGVHVWLPGDPADPTATVERIATRLPAGEGGGPGDGIGPGTRDAVVVEVALEEVSGFQDPERLLEPALGGPDTTGRIVPRTALRLARLHDGEGCQALARRLADAAGGRGRLTVTLDPPETVVGDCPTVDGGGYTGFEHRLYRVEMARTAAPAPHIVWSRDNGGLVGRGRFEAGTPNRVVITANRNAILTSGRDRFHLEALAHDPEHGHWRVVYAAAASLGSDGELELSEPPVFGTFAFDDAPVFFRLWDGLAAAADFEGGPAPLEAGIQLELTPPADGGGYRAGDYWTFTVRAGGIGNPETLVDEAPPHGPTLRRVPLAQVTWNADADVAGLPAIRDCRRRIRPLVDVETCCTLRVGDGVRSFGDFNSLEEAAAHLPPAGGELCLLPGVHQANLVLENRANVRITGCARRTRVLPRAATPDRPVIALRDCLGIEIRELDLVSFFGPAVEARGTRAGACRDVELHHCRLMGRGRVVGCDDVEGLKLSWNRVRLLDAEAGSAALDLRVEGALVERNDVRVQPLQEAPGEGDEPDDPQRPVRPIDPCSEPELTYGPGLMTHVAWAVLVLDARIVGIDLRPRWRAWGGVHLRPGSARVRLLENRIAGGAGHGVTLGGRLPGDDDGGPGRDPAEPPEEAAPRLENRSGRLIVRVRDEANTPLAGIALSLWRGTTLVATEVSTGGSAPGRAIFSADPGEYRLGVAPGWEVVEVERIEFEGGLMYDITLARAAPAVNPDAAGLVRITLEGNEIRGMGLSGIGFRPWRDEAPDPAQPELDDPEAVAAWLAGVFAPRQLVATTNPVRRLIVRGNLIEANLQAVFDDDLRRSVRQVGQGGISLGLVESGRIDDNEIVGNGRDAVNPTCGIFVGFAEDLLIRGNRIAANGPVRGEGYETDKHEGLRGGVFVRFASSMLTGGVDDGDHKPAVRLVDNRIDQPAGRAVTVLAFGPVACVGNDLNAERAGRWSILDLMVGGVLILTLGGLHRHRRPTPPRASAGGGPNGGGDGNGAPVEATPPLSAYPYDESRASAPSFGDARLAELRLPGGEVMVNSNQIRLGPENRALSSTVVVSLDDVGLDGNQSSVFRRDLLFTNALAAGLSVRATDNRLREHTWQCWLSLLSWSMGLGEEGRFLAMNTTAHNQADHCIVALTNAPRPPGSGPFGPPVVRDGNLVVNEGFCANMTEGEEGGRRFVRQALVATLLQRLAAENAFDRPAEQGQELTLQAVTTVQQVQQARAYTQQAEAARLEVRLGADHPRVSELRGRSTTLLQSAGALELERDLVRVRPVAVPEAGAVLDGRVTDAAGRGRAGVDVELVGPDEAVLDVRARTDTSGYWAVPLDAARAEELQDRALRVQVRDPRSGVVTRAAEPVAVAPSARIRTHVRLAEAGFEEARVVERQRVWVRPAPTARPGGRSTPLEDVKGIGPVTAQKLRDAGIPDLESYLRTSGERLVEIHGFDARVLRERARERMDEIEREARQEEEEPRAGNDPERRRGG